jgi:hypothetical protein
MGGRRSVYRVLVGRPEGEGHLKDVDLDGRIILQRIFKKGDGGGMDWFDLAQERGR